MSFRMIVVDLDGTLLTSNGSISVRSREAIDSCVENGLWVILASARPPRSTLHYSRQLNLKAPVINYNGALIQNPFTNDVYYSNPIPLKLAAETLCEIKGFDSRAITSVEIEDKIYFEDGCEMSFKRYTESSAEARAEPYVVMVESLYEFLSSTDSRPPGKILVSTAAEKGKSVADLEAHLSTRFRDRLSFIKSELRLLEIANSGASKARAIEVLADQLNISRDEIAAIGDSFNDIEMIEFARCGIAMGNARDEVKAKAQYVTDINDNDGVANAIERIVLAQPCEGQKPSQG